MDDRGALSRRRSGAGECERPESCLMQGVTGGTGPWCLSGRAHDRGTKTRAGTSAGDGLWVGSVR